MFTPDAQGALTFRACLQSYVSKIVTEFKWSDKSEFDCQGTQNPLKVIVHIFQSEKKKPKKSEFDRDKMNMYTNEFSGFISIIESNQSQEKQNLGTFSQIIRPFFFTNHQTLPARIHGTITFP